VINLLYETPEFIFTRIPNLSLSATTQVFLGLRGVVNAIPCTGYARGVELHARGLPIYPECVSVPLEDDADVTDPETRWLMKGPV
jgi:hypothetical protein